MTHDEIEWYARHFDHLAALYAAENGADDATRWSRAAALIRRLRDERDQANIAWEETEFAIREARSKALDEGAAIVRSQFMNEAEALARRILALKTQEPKP